MDLQGTRLSRFAAARLLHPTWAHNALLAADRLPAPMPPLACAGAPSSWALAGTLAAPAGQQCGSRDPGWGP